jgi:hypothetical protein
LERSDRGQKTKIIQVLAYAFMYEHEANGKPIEAGIISFKNLNQDFTF